LTAYFRNIGLDAAMNLAQIIVKNVNLIALRTLASLGYTIGFNFL